MNIETTYANKYKSIQQISSDSDILVFAITEKDKKVYEKFLSGTNGEFRKSISLLDINSIFKDFSNNKIAINSNTERKTFVVLKNVDLAEQEKYKWLSKREKEVLSELFSGKRYKQIADSLFISVNTVKFHIKSIYQKFNIHSQSEAISLAVKMGLTAH